MAKGKLTERQEQIVDLLKQDKTPAEIGKALKISTNGVYQQMRRIRKIPGYKTIGNTGGSTGTTTAKASTAKATRKRSASSGRQSTRTAAAEPQAEVIVKPPSAKDVLSAEVRDTKAKIAEQAAIIEQADKDKAKAQERIDALTIELTAREDTLAVLTGEKVAHARPAAKQAPKPADTAKPSGNGSGRRKTAAQAVQEQDEAKAKAKAEAEAQEAAQASTEAPQAATVTEEQAEATPDPFEGGDDTSAQAAAEAPQETPAAA
jgi:hypothetical protein